MNIKVHKFLLVSVVLLISAGLAAGSASSQEFPIGGAFDNSEPRPDPAGSLSEFNDNPGPVHRSLSPLRSAPLDDPVPIPDFILRAEENSQHYPGFYTDLMQVAPSDQVQSLVFDSAGFQKARRICVVEFDNKTSGRFKDEQAARVVTRQVSKELRTLQNYTITLDPGDAHLKIVSPQGKAPVGQEAVTTPEGEKAKAAPVRSFSCSEGQVDAYLVGAVTQFVNSYVDRHGKTRESLSAGVEFGVFLVRKNPDNASGPKKTLDPKNVLWGARYVGSQPTGLSAIARGEIRWLSKEELSRSAMKNILKDFHRRR